MFPGQGSQKTGMGQEVLEKYTAIVSKASEIAEFDIADVCLNPEQKDTLKKTQFTQPCLYLVNGLMYREKEEQGQIDAKNSIFIGHSLGEYNALQAAGVIDLLDGVRLVANRGKLMNSTGLQSQTKGGMAAVLGLSYEKVNDVLKESDHVWIANDNTLGQIVISGAKEKIDQLIAPLKESGAKRVLPLEVSGAFHTPLMDEAARAFSKILSEIDFKSPTNPVYSNVTAYEHSADVDQIRKMMAEQMTNGVRWRETLQNIIEAQKLEKTAFVEVGPGNVLTGLVNRMF